MGIIVSCIGLPVAACRAIAGIEGVYLDDGGMDASSDVAIDGSVDDGRADGDASDDVVEAGWDPSYVASTVLWLRAEDARIEDAGVSAWNDRSGAAHHLVQADGQKRPRYKPNAGPRGGPCLTFDGADDYLEFATPWSQQVPTTIYAVASSSGGGANQVLFERGSPANAPSPYFSLLGRVGVYWKAYLTPGNYVPTATWEVWRWRITPSVIGIRRGGSSESTEPPTASQVDRWLSLSTAVPDNTLGASIAEVVVLHEDVTVGHDGQMTSYLSRRYGL